MGEMLHVPTACFEGASIKPTMSRLVSSLTVPDATLPRPSLALRTGALELTPVAHLPGHSRRLLHRRHYGL